MSLALFIYFAGMFDTLNQLFQILWTLSTVASVLGLVYYGIATFNYHQHSEREKESYVKCVAAIKKVFIAWIVSGCLFVITPSAKTMYLMAGAHIGQSAVEDALVSPEMDKVRSILQKKLDEMLEDDEEEDDDA